MRSGIIKKTATRAVFIQSSEYVVSYKCGSLSRSASGSEPLKLAEERDAAAWLIIETIPLSI